MNEEQMFLSLQMVPLYCKKLHKAMIIHRDKHKLIDLTSANKVNKFSHAGVSGGTTSRQKALIHEMKN